MRWDRAATCVEEGAAKVLEVGGDHEENVEQDGRIVRVKMGIG